MSDENDKAEESTPPLLNVHQRLAQAMKTVTYVQKDKPSGMKYSIVSHDAVTAKVRPALLAAGVIYYPQDLRHTQNGNRTEVTLTVAFVNIDDPADKITVPGLGYGIDAQDKGPGKAISYAVKYCLLKALGLETGDDPDLDQKTEHVVDEPLQLAPDGTPVPTLEYALVACAESIAIITGGIDGEDWSSASEAWAELTGGEKIALWVAPSKEMNAPFTTKQREIIHSKDFREANGT